MMPCYYGNLFYQSLFLLQLVHIHNINPFIIKNIQIQINNIISITISIKYHQKQKAINYKKTLNSIHFIFQQQPYLKSLKKMQTRLFLKQKDYQLNSFKSQVKFNQSINDPIINPKLRNNKKGNNFMNNDDKNNAKKKNMKNVLNPLAPSGSNNNMKNQNAMKQKDGQEDQENVNFKVETPWTKILQLFNKNYNFDKQSSDKQISNPFGSYGLKIEEQLKGISTKDSKLKIQEKDQPQKTTISIKTYLKAIQLMKKELEQKWAQQDKVACLQITIQACKLLHDTKYTKFHALKFAYVMEIVDRFGILVFQRIKKLAFPHLNRQKLQQINMQTLLQSNIPESAQQICRNWLLKIASIRQLIPRTIIETTLLRLHFFINGGIKGRSAFQRLYKSNRCFAQNLNCLFFCTFLVRIGKQVLPQEKNYIIQLLEDVFYYLKQGKTKFLKEDVSYDEYFTIVEPFFITSFQSLAQNLSKEKFRKVFTMVQTFQNPPFVILKNFIQSFSPSLLTIYSCEIVQLIQRTQQNHKYLLYKILITKIRSMVFNRSGQFIVLVWTNINKLNDIEILLDILGPFSQIIFRNLPNYQKNKFYALILDKFSTIFQNFGRSKMNKNRLQRFQLFLSEIIKRTQDIKDIVTLEPFLQLISYFPHIKKQQISFNIVKAFVQKSSIKIKDPVVLHIMLTLIKNISGYKIGKVNQDKQVQLLLLKFIDKVEFQGKELDDLLNFYSQIRASFGYLEKVIITIIYKAAGLTFKARKTNKGKITNKLIAFLQATVAFCYITVPVIEKPQVKLKLYIFLSEVALNNNLISQATSFIKTCIAQLAEIQLKTDVQTYNIFQRIVSFMIVMPDDPQKDFLFLFNGLLQAFQVSKFKSNLQNLVKFQFYSNCINYLSCQAHQKLPFHIEGVTSNDGLFKSVEFKKALIEKIYQIFEKMEGTIDKLQKASITTDQAFDLYLLQNLPYEIMKIVDIFQDNQRIKDFLTKCTKLFTQVKDRFIRRQNPKNIQKIKKLIDGYNSKLKQNKYNQIKIS